MPVSIVQWPLDWDERWSKEKVKTVESAFGSMVKEADYVVVLAPDCWNADHVRYPAYYPKWAELSQRLIESKLFQPLTDPLSVTERESFIVLARTAKK